MSFPLFIARRMYRNNDHSRRVSKPAVTIAVAGIATGLAIMILSIGIAIGFKNEVRAKVTGIGTHLQIGSYDRTESYESTPIVANDSLMEMLYTQVPEIAHIQRYTTKAGMMKTDNQVQGFILKGVGQEYDWRFIRQHLTAGEIPMFTDSVASNEVMISEQLAQKMGLEIGDKVYTYYIEENVRARRLTIKALFKTNFAEFDNLFLITDLYTANRLNQWRPDQTSGMEIALDDPAKMEHATYHVGQLVNRHTDHYGNSYLALNIEQLYPSIFSWLQVLDTNVWVILILMTGVAGFTMISGLLILILERTNMIGLLKALGATDNTIRKTFLYFAIMLIGKGLLIGNIAGIALGWLQHKFEFVHLDPATYYVDAVPIELSFSSIALLNVSTLVVSIAMLIGPSHLISRIKPARSMQFE